MPVEADRAAAVGGAWRIVPMNIRRQRYVGYAREAAKGDRHLFRIELRRTEGFQDLRTRMVPFAPVEHAVRRKVTYQVRVVRPPDRSFVAAHVEVHEVVRLPPTDVHNHHPPVDLRPGAVKDDAALLIVAPFVAAFLVKAPEEEDVDKWGGLRPTDSDCLGDAAGDRV